jgi:hypothetical protein
VLALALVLVAPTSAAQRYKVSLHAFTFPKGGPTGGTWTSPWYSTAFGFTELVASWNTSTPAGSWIEVLEPEVRPSDLAAESEAA